MLINDRERDHGDLQASLAKDRSPCRAEPLRLRCEASRCAPVIRCCCADCAAVGVRLGQRWHSKDSNPKAGSKNDAWHSLLPDVTAAIPLSRNSGASR
jgi:hypothetical protein